MPCSNACTSPMAPARRVRWLTALTAGILLTGASVAAPEETAAPMATGAEQSDSGIETIEVSAARESLRKVVASFVSSVTRADGESVARWRVPICPWITGASAEQAAFIKSRIVEISKSVGVRVDGKPQCKANLSVFLTTEPGKLLALLRQRSPRTFGDATLKEAKDLETARPVRIWQNSMLMNADGTPPITRDNRAPQFRLEDSRIASSVAEDITAVTVVVDTNATGAATFGQLADYVTMVALAQVDMTADFGNSPTILRLFANQDPQRLPRQMTDWDHAFLKALYGMGDPLKHQRNAITSRMMQDLVPSSY